MNHADPRLQQEITHLFHFSMDWESWTVIARSYCKSREFFFLPLLPRNAFRNDTHFTPILWIERRLGAGGVLWVTDWKKGGWRRKCAAFRNNFIFFVTSLPGVRPLYHRHDLCFQVCSLSPISVVKVLQLSVWPRLCQPWLRGPVSCYLETLKIQLIPLRWDKIKIRRHIWKHDQVSLLYL